VRQAQEAVVNDRMSICSWGAERRCCRFATLVAGNNAARSTPDGSSDESLLHSWLAEKSI